MLDRPPLTDAQIAETLERGWGLEIRRIEFLALGHDANAWTFRADPLAGAPVFVKIRRTVDAIRLAALAYLSEHGIDAVVAPLRSIAGALSMPIDGLHVVAYPLVVARPAAEVGLTDAQWQTYGSIVGRLHATTLPAAIEAALPRESFVPGSIGVLEGVRTIVERDPAVGGDDLDREVRRVWRVHRAEVEAIARRTIELSDQLRASVDRVGSSGFVPCHGDVHTYNVLVDEHGSLVVVDWDDIVMAPRERDLMFIVGSPIGMPRGTHELEQFFRGYGPVEIDPRRLAYYHAEWAVQDVASHTEQALSSESGRPSRMDALRILAGLFEPGDEVDVALNWDPEHLPV